MHKAQEENKRYHKKNLKKIKKVLDKLKNLWYNKYVIKRENLLDK